MILAATAPGYNQVVTGVLGFLVVAAMGLALFFLLRSMNKQLHKVLPGPRWREKADKAKPPAAPPAADKNFRQNGTRLS